MRKLSFVLFILIATSQLTRAVGSVEVRGSRLLIDGHAEPQLFGAEIQYFRLRGGYGRNIQRAKVIALWNKALDHAVEAKMNAISFYIPWDFHEYAEGKFDFTGTVDEDGDGKPDYPSRDLRTFFKLIAAHGIKRILVRPGPYINAEWGFLGFGAIPSWFHDKYPESHMMTPWGWHRPLYDYHNLDLLRHTRLWFEALYNQVLRDQMGPGKPIAFLQIDNETNFQWQSLYQADYGPPAVARYQEFLKQNYSDLNSLNKAHGQNWSDWNLVQPPPKPSKSVVEDRDWYRFNDQTIYTFLQEIRKLWENIGVHEPQVMFTLAESFNAPFNGLLPNYIYKNKRGLTGLMTVNLYPKTDETPQKPLLNRPFKADLDVKSQAEAGNAYFGTTGQDWAMGPEIQGGWFKGTEVTDEARQQTYLSVIGHGLKAFFIYYFNEGQNWDIEWSYGRIKPLFDGLRIERHVEATPVPELDNAFWGELQSRCDRLIIVGLDVRGLMERGVPTNSENVHFESPLDENADPRGHFAGLKLVGERVIAPYRHFLSRALEVTDSVAIIRDNASHLPSASPGIDSTRVASDWNGGLLGYLMNASLNPRILFGDLSEESEFNDLKFLTHIDTGINAPRTVELLQKAVERGQTVINFLADDITQALGSPVPAAMISQPTAGPQTVQFYVNSKGQLASGNEPDAHIRQMTAMWPIYSYNMSGARNCRSILFWQGQAVGYDCKLTRGHVIQIGAMIFEDYNSNEYSEMGDGAVRRQFLKLLLGGHALRPHIWLSRNAKQVVAFARRDPLHKILWITVKSGSRKAQSVQVHADPALLDELIPSQDNNYFRVTDIMSSSAGRSLVLTAKKISDDGFTIDLPPSGSTVIVIH